LRRIRDIRRFGGAVLVGRPAASKGEAMTEKQDKPCKTCKGIRKTLGIKEQGINGSPGHIKTHVIIPCPKCQEPAEKQSELVFGNSKCPVCGETTPLPGLHKCNPSYKELKARLAAAEKREIKAYKKGKADAYENYNVHIKEVHDYSNEQGRKIKQLESRLAEQAAFIAKEQSHGRK
jgi:hypothetical protein